MEPTAPPKPTKADWLYTLAKAGMSGIPIVGSPAAEIFGALLMPPLSRRRDQWMESIGVGLKTLEEKVDGFTIESLQTNEMFITAALHATQIAIRNHQTDKQQALRNAVLNVACGKAPDEDLQLIFLNYVDTFTTWHMRILHFFQKPEAYMKAKGIPVVEISIGDAPATLLKHTFPEIREVFYGQIVKDLATHSLLSSADFLNVMMTASGAYAKRTTVTGDMFLAFIASSI